VGSQARDGLDLHTSICAGIGTLSKSADALQLPQHTAAAAMRAPCPACCRVGAPLVLRQLLTWFVAYEQSGGDTQASLPP
jgi:hypothetical protein